MANSSEDLKCKICDVTFNKKNDFEMHLNSKKHKIKDEAHHEKCGIFVTGFHPNTKESDLSKYFSQFGNVIWAHFGHQFILLDFIEPSSVQTVLIRNHYLNGRKLVVKPKKPRVQNMHVNNTEATDDHQHFVILNSLQKMSNFDEEAEFLRGKLQPNWNQVVSKFNQISQDLYRALSGRFPYVQINPFGSTVTELSFNNSDIDFYIGNVKHPLFDDEVGVLQEIKQLLGKSKLFNKGIVIPGAKIPIVKCVHYQTRTKLDLNINNMLGVCNSRLIHYYMGLHPKVKLVTVILKYWGKVHKITGQNHLLTSYSLIMLLIFFLQVKFQFPAVYCLQDNVICPEESWLGEFIPRNISLTEVFYSTPVLEILKQFFEYYGEFDYDTDIISPYLGEAIDKRNFKPPNIPDEFSRYKTYIADEDNLPFKESTPMCIQDPFEHCRNISGVITDSTLERFISFCKLGENVCSEEGAVLYRLLSKEPASLKTPEFRLKGEKILEMTLHKKGNLKYLKYSKDCDKFEDDMWFESVVNFISIAFQDFLAITMEEDDSNKSKTTKTEGQTDVHDMGVLKVFSCEAKVNMWDARKKTAKQIKLNKNATTLVEKESLITNHLNEIYKNFQDVEKIIAFSLSLEDKRGSVLISLEQTFSYKKSFRSFALFIGSNLPIWFDLYEKDCNKAVLNLNDTQ